MKNFRLIFLTIFLLCFICLTAFADGATKISIDGKVLTLTVQPVIVNGRTLVPLRAIFEALNVVPVWDNATKSVTAKSGSVDMLLKIGSSTAVVNNKIVNLDVPGTLINNSTMVPARFIAETFGGDVKWDDVTKTVMIRTADNIASSIPNTPVVPPSTPPIQPTTFTPTTLHATLYGFMNDYMTRFEGRHFNSKISLGKIEIYRPELSEVKIIINEKLEGLGQYDPETDTITLSFDPSKQLSWAESEALKELIWHEVGHKIENTNGDPEAALEGDSEAKALLYRNRNLEYMQLISQALNRLTDMEDETDEEKIREAWFKFEKAYDAALNLEETKAYPPDLENLEKWFGFSVDKKVILEHYKSGQAGELLKNALSKPILVWSGTWKTNFGTLKLVQNGTNCNGSYDYQGGKVTGTVSGDTFTGTWTETDDQGTFSFKMSADAKSYSGSWKETSPNPSQGGSWTGTR